MSDSVRPQRWQPTRLLRPWDLPGKILEWVAIAFFLLWVISKFGIVTPYQIWLANILFATFFCWGFPLLYRSFLILCLFVFAFVSLAWRAISREILLRPKSRNALPVSFKQFCMVLVLYSSLIYFELVFMYGTKNSHFFFMQLSSFSHHLLKR